MQYLYFDESGSMTKEYAEKSPDFVICMIHVFDITNLRKFFRKFVIDHIEELKACDYNNKIFKNHMFVELKASSLSKSLKLRLCEYLCHYHLFEVYYIHVNNKEVEDKFYKDTSLAYNYLIKLLLERCLKEGFMPNDSYLLSMDERNLAQISLNSLEDYLNIEFCLKEDLAKKIDVEYFDSKDNALVQLSDFFSNFYYTYLVNRKEYEELFNKIYDENYIRDIYYYPE